eukprot:m.85733 g.85733  ORF g.85733 m.85733 type:complete len:1526 (-) comp8753_c0_seq2:1876-6453(-)
MISPEPLLHDGKEKGSRDGNANIFIFELEKDVDLTAKLFRMMQGTKLKIVPSVEYRGVPLTFSWNYPSIGKEMDRNVFTKLEWTRESSLDRFINVKLDRPGNFNFRYKSADGSVVTGTFLVEPFLHLAGKKATLAAVAIHTQVPRCLGPVEEWWNRILVSTTSGFNLIHFCPLQTWGGSQSPYSIKDQLKFEPSLFGNDCMEAEVKLKKFLAQGRKAKEDGGLGCGFIVDVVYNHTSIDTPWLVDHPEAGYTLSNSPHLKPAYVLDRYIGFFSKLVGEECLIHHEKHVPSVVSCEEDIDFVLDAFFEQSNMGMRLWEFFIIDVEHAIETAASVIHSISPAAQEDYEGKDSLDDSFVLENKTGGRFSKTLDIPRALSFLKKMYNSDDEAMLLLKLQHFINEYNLLFHKQLEEDLAVARMHLKNTMIWERLDPNGPKKGPISARVPMVFLYFHDLKEAHKHEFASLLECPLEGLHGQYSFACNGWVWDQESSHEFASASTRCYFRREVNIWGDSVKLRYGSTPADNPWLWNHMGEYTRKMALLFCGLRIDNCHSTPLNVGAHMMDVARKANSNVVVFAELFTPKEEMAVEYINRFGINSLLLECMSPDSVRDYSALLHRYGGNPVGSFMSLPHVPLHLTPHRPRATLLSASHDNEFPATKQTVFNSLPLSALASMIHNGVGSTRCYEELLLKNLSIVNEQHRYCKWGDANLHDCVDLSVGILDPVRAMNRLHQKMDHDGFTEVYVDHLDDSCISITRRNPKSLEEIVIIAFMVYHHSDTHCGSRTIGPFPKSGDVDSILFRSFPVSYEVKHPSEHCKECGRACLFAQGLKIKYAFSENVPFVDTVVAKGSNMCVTLRPGEVICFKIVPNSLVQEKYKHTLDLIRYFAEEHDDDINAMTSIDLNHALFRCERENETQAYIDDGVYDIPGHGKLKYAGLAGVIPLIADIVKENNLAHPLCDNVRAGDWLIGYIGAHMHKRKGTRFIGVALEEIVENYKHLPINVKPMLFTQIISTVYSSLEKYLLETVHDDGTFSSSFGRKLAIAAFQFYGCDAHYQLQGTEFFSLSAGLPHFSAGWMRCWGRDTFIALRGCMLCTGLYKEAKEMIVAFARVVRHGLVPNLFDNGNNPRFNCRDATWFFLQAIKDYCTMTKDNTLLDEKVERKFMNDTSGEPEYCVMSLSNIIIEILEKHVKGISYREWGAGAGIDTDMSDDGFNVTIGVQEDTGFIFGGSHNNCGTWMDKMGSSEKAGNKGIPATPRDGADVEIIGLAYSTISWIANLQEKGSFPTTDLTFENGTNWTCEEWSNTIKASFEKHFYIPTHEDMKKAGYMKFNIDEALVNRRGCYKDSFGSSDRYTDYQLRPNVAIAMTVAPDLFDPNHARQHLCLCREVLVGGMGMRTLDPSDWKYRPNYDNSNDSNDITIARGWNYHQGPEWLWPVGFQLRAELIFSEDKMKTIGEINCHLGRFESHISTSPWMVLFVIVHNIYVFRGLLFFSPGMPLLFNIVVILIIICCFITPPQKKNQGPSRVVQ